MNAATELGEVILPQLLLHLLRTLTPTQVTFLPDTDSRWPSSLTAAPAPAYLGAVASWLALVESRHERLAVDGVPHHMLLDLFFVGEPGVVVEGVVGRRGALR